MISTDGYNSINISMTSYFHGQSVKEKITRSGSPVKRSDSTGSFLSNTSHMGLKTGLTSISADFSNTADIHKEVQPTHHQNQSPLLTDEMSPEVAFVHYQKRSEDQYCQVCGQPSVGFHHRAYVCEACKKFFTRHMTMRVRKDKEGTVDTETFAGRELRTVCPMGGQCRIEGPGRGKCPHCRFRKCLDLGMSLTPPGGEMGCDISQIPCRVCGSPSSGFHFGAITCEGCKGFFRRTALSNVKLECLGKHNCCITPANRNMCKSCRFQRCLAVGMSQKGSRIGRQPNAIKYYCVREISQLAGKAELINNTDPASRSSSSKSPLATAKDDDIIRLSSVNSRTCLNSDHSDATHLPTKATLSTGFRHDTKSKHHRPLTDMHIPDCRTNAKRAKRNNLNLAANSSGSGGVTWEDMNPLLISDVMNKLGAEGARGTACWPRKVMPNGADGSGVGGGGNESRPCQPLTVDCVDGEMHQLGIPEPSHSQPQHQPYLAQLKAYNMENGKVMINDRSPDVRFTSRDVSSSTTATTPNDQSVNILRSLIKQIIHESTAVSSGPGLNVVETVSTATHKHSTGPSSTATPISRHSNDCLTNHQLALPAQAFCRQRDHFTANACFLDGISSTSGAGGDSNCTNVFLQPGPTFPRCRPAAEHEICRHSSSQTYHVGVPHFFTSLPSSSPTPGRGDRALSPISTPEVVQQPPMSAGLPLAVSDLNTSTVAAAMLAAQASFSMVNGITGEPIQFPHPPTATHGIGVFPGATASWNSFAPQEMAQPPPALTRDGGAFGADRVCSSGITSDPDRHHGFSLEGATTNTAALAQSPQMPVRQATGNYHNLKPHDKMSDYPRGVLPSPLIQLQPNITVPLSEFTMGISIAAKYLRSERDRMNRHQHDLDPRFSDTDSTEVVWENMMKAFEMHSKMVVNFTKIIPGINRLELNDKRQLVRSAMYPLMLVTLSRDFENGRYPRYNYFNFSEKEREVILQNFPAFKRVVNHLIQSGEMLHHLMLDDIEFTLICTQELLRSQNDLSDPTSCQHLLLLSMQVLVNHEQSIAKPEIASQRLTAISRIAAYAKSLQH